jgi:hypothetical protein
MDILSKHMLELNSTGCRVRIVEYALALFMLFFVIILSFSRKQTYKAKYKKLSYKTCSAIPTSKLMPD